LLNIFPRTNSGRQWRKDNIIFLWTHRRLVAGINQVNERNDLILHAIFRRSKSHFLNGLLFGTAIKCDGANTISMESEAHQVLDMNVSPYILAGLLVSCTPWCVHSSNNEMHHVLSKTVGILDDDYMAKSDHFCTTHATDALRTT